MTVQTASALHSLLEQAVAERDEARDALMRATQAQSQAEGQLQQLQAFGNDYDQRWQQQFRSGAAIEVMRCYQDFTRRLHQATDQQRHNSKLAAGQVERARERLVAREMRVASVRALIERREQEARQAAARQDQKLTDEAASRIGRLARGPSSTLPT